MKVQGNRSHGCERKLHGSIHAVPGIFMETALRQCQPLPVLQQVITVSQWA